MSTFTADAVAALPGSDSLRSRRAAAFERFREKGLPSEAEEVWRYSRISELDLDAYTPVTPGTSAPREGVPAGVEPVLAALGDRAGLIVLRDGAVTYTEVVPALAERGLTVGPLATGDGAELVSDVAAAPDAFVELATAFAGDGALVRVPRGVAVRRPVVVVHWVDTDGAAVFPRTVVEAGDASEATVVDVVASADVAAFLAPVVELDARQAANLRYLNLQQLGPRVWQVAHQASRVAKEAHLQSCIAALGGDYARVRADSRLVGEGATSDLLAAYFGEGHQQHDFRTMQDHEAPKTTSDLLFKGAVSGRAHSVYSGLIRVRKGAAGTNAFQTNRNLVLGDGARADSVPNLEIEENDVRCSHASAVGPIDEEQRYYLEARGVPPEVADKLIVLGFFADVLDRVPVPELRPLLRRAVAGKLERVVA